MIWWFACTTFMLVVVAHAAARSVTKYARTADFEIGWLRLDDAWLAWDKVQHFALGFIVHVISRVLFRDQLGMRIWLTSDVLLGVEVWQLGRLATWLEKGAPDPWPWETDGMSWRDMIAGWVGMIAAEGAMYLICRP